MQNRVSTPNRHADTLVVGAGVIGISTAFYLVQQGRRVVVLDMDEVCSGASHGNAGLAGPSHLTPLAAPGVVAKAIKWMFDGASPFYVKPRLDPGLIAWMWQFWRACEPSRARAAMAVLAKLCRDSAAAFEALAARGDLAFCYQKRGLLTLLRTEQAVSDAEADIDVMTRFGVTTQCVDRDGLRALLGSTTATSAIGGLFTPEDSHMDPAAFVHSLAKVCLSLGVEIWPRTEVLGMQTCGDKVDKVITTRGNFVARNVVIACGAWSSQLVRSIGLNLPMQSGKGYSITVRRPPQFPELALYLQDAKVAVTPMGPHLRYAGTMEMAGFDRSINQRRVQAIRQAVQTYLPSLPESEMVELWRGLRPCSSDGLPFIGRSGKVGNVLIATGHSMLGLMLGPVTGQMVTRLICGEDPGMDLAPLRPERHT